MTNHEEVGSPVDPRIGLLLGGRYRVGSPRGSGAMGVVYEGVHESLGRKVAVKCLHPHLASSPSFVTRFMSEARLASRLSHPNIVRMYDFGTEQIGDQSLLYLVMEFCSGHQLGALLAQGGGFSLARIGSIMNQVLSALAESHDHGIVHRDVKPDNVILEPLARGAEVAKLIDFGIAESRTDGRPASECIAGTPGYLSPEVIRGEPLDHQADLYAAGAMLFELVTGKPLFEGETVGQILEKQLREERPDPRTVAPDRSIPAALAEVCLRSVAFDPRARFEDADAFADALSAALSGPATGVPASAPPAPANQPRPPLESTPQVPASQPRPPLESAPQFRSSPVGRYSMAPVEERISGVHTVAQRGPTFWALQELEHEATLAMARRRWSEALEKLQRGLDAAALLEKGGQPELAAAAFTAFGRRMGEALRRTGHPAEGANVLKKALAHAPEPQLSRALLLEELGLCASAAGRSGEAVGAWLDAVEAARGSRNDAVEHRLLRRLGAGRMPRP